MNSLIRGIPQVVVNEAPGRKLSNSFRAPAVDGGNLALRSIPKSTVIAIVGTM